MFDETLLNHCRPELIAAAHRHYALCEQAHLTVKLDSGFRTGDQQWANYMKGRKQTPAGWVVVDPHAVVTNATPEHAPHCRGAAYDLWLLFGRAGEGHLRLATMNPRDGWTQDEIEQQTTLWGAVVKLGVRLGLVAGAQWPKLKDWPHFELPNWRDLPMPQEAHTWISNPGIGPASSGSPS